MYKGDSMTRVELVSLTIALEWAVKCQEQAIAQLEWLQGKGRHAVNLSGKPAADIERLLIQARLLRKNTGDLLEEAARMTPESGAAIPEVPLAVEDPGGVVAVT